MFAKALFATVLCAADVLLLPCTAAEPGKTPQQPSAIALWERSVARRAAVTILEDVHALSRAVDQWALENRKPADAVPKPEELAVYLKPGSRLRAELSAGRCNDALGNPMTLRGSDRTPLLSRATVQQFAAVTEPGFWHGYYEGPELSTVEPAPANPQTTHELRATATWLASEMRMLDAAIDQWAIEHNKPDGAQPRPGDLLPYVTKGTRLYRELAAGRTNDSLGNPIKIRPLGEIPQIDQATTKRLAPAVPADFWGPFAGK